MLCARVFLLSLAAISLLSACRTKPSAVMYDGSGPTVHYHEAETAGGPMRKSRYR